MKDVIAQLKRCKAGVVVYGIGGQGERVANYLEKQNVEIICFCETIKSVDVFRGKVVFSYDELVKNYGKYVIIVAAIPTTAKEIINYLTKKNERNLIIPMCMPFKMEDRFLNVEEYDNAIEKVKELFYDEESKKIFIGFLNYKLSGNGLWLLKQISGNSFFDEILLDRKVNYTFVDCGAYTGDTIIKFLQFNGLNYNKILGIEMENGNFEALNKMIEYAKIDKIKTYNCALSDKEKNVTYYTKSGLNFFNANLYNSIYRVSSKLERENVLESNQVEIEVNTTTRTLDSILEFENHNLQAGKVMIKLNAMGAEYEILQGSANIIRKYKPIFIFDYASFSEDIVKIPQFIRAICPSYKFFLRQKLIFGDSKTVLYLKV